MISIKSLDKYFNKHKQNEIHVINNINLDLPDKGMVAIFGQSGCGKTTLLNTIGGLDKYDSGSILIESEKINPNNTDLRNKNIGYIFQNYNLNMTQSNIDNVSDALRLCGVTDEDFIKELSLKALKNVGLENYAYRLSNTLSGGQMQRVAIARAIVKNPKIILADEPTGNLDETNTVMVMDLLKEISKEHLVLLVTHEADLVDHYCDIVIELQDGNVKNIKENNISSKYTKKDKNAIYLGELEKEEVKNDSNISIDYYGEKPSKKFKLKIINKNGKIYLNLDDEEIKLIDNNSELKVYDGVYEGGEDSGESINSSFEEMVIPSEKCCGKTGKLFNLKSSIKSGYIYNFKNKNNKGNKLLRTSMILFGMILVYTIALFGVSLGNMLKINTSYNHNVFYINIADDDNKVKLSNLDSTEGTYVDSVTYMQAYYCGDTSIRFNTPEFESFNDNNGWYQSNYSVDGAVLESKLCDGYNVLVGKKDNLKYDEMVISKTVADKLIEKSKYGYIKSYKNLIGLRTSDYKFDGKGIKIVGIVDTVETAFYVNLVVLAQYRINNNGFKIALDETITNDNEVTLCCYGEQEYFESEFLNKKAKINGKEYTITKVIAEQEDYYGSNKYLVSKKTYESFAKPIEKSDTIADPYGEYENYYGNNKKWYTVHSTNVKATEEYLRTNYSYLFEMIDGDYVNIQTPDSIRKTNTLNLVGDMVGKFIALAVVFTLMAICIYFVMKSSLMTRIKEVGIYRAIGVSKKNLVFKFLVESIVLTTLTVFIGYLLCSVFMYSLANNSTLMKQTLYYPGWLALVLLGFIYGLSMIFGVLPVNSLLRKSPSEILAKYDI